MSKTPDPAAWPEDSAGDLAPLPEETCARYTRCPAAHQPIDIVKAVLSRAAPGSAAALTVGYPMPDGSWRMLVIGSDGQIKSRLPVTGADGAARVGLAGPNPAGAATIPALGVRTDACDQALDDLDRKVRAAGFKSAGDMLDQLLAWLSSQREQTAVIDGVLSDLDAQLTEAGFPHVEGGSLATRLRAALARPTTFEATWQRFLEACGYTQQPVERISMSWVIELARAKAALAAVTSAATEAAPTAASLAQAIDDAERRYLTFHGWKPAPDGRPDFWIDPTNDCPWPRAGALAVQRDRNAVPVPDFTTMSDMDLHLWLCHPSGGPCVKAVCLNADPERERLWKLATSGTTPPR